MKTLTEISVKEMAKNLVGDGKRPNKYFVTIAYGWHKPYGEEELIKPENSLESSTLLFTNKAKAMDFFNSIPIEAGLPEVTGETIGQIMIEDRLTGVLAEKYLYQSKTGRYYIDSF